MLNSPAGWGRAHARHAVGEVRRGDARKVGVGDVEGAVIAGAVDGTQVGTARR